ncbi:calcium uniporter protein 2, mitochondrial [Elaeis guineensis]|uniref:Calcium uniporter protein 2, mitochondrial n=1 Tax=Elaeis guineensis var. tenera TaxID=51953 RepID=A0A6I9S1A0_ELAGV|nr:calcium uniporter protein 2, mitochondrial [Elaeis guineensis]
MAFGKTLAHRFVNAAKSLPAGTLLPPRLHIAEPSSYLRRLLPDSSEERGLLRRFLQWRALFQSAERLPLPVGNALADRIRQLNRERLRLEGLVPPPRSPSAGTQEEEERISVEEARKVLRAAQMEAARARLRGIQRSCVAYTEFTQICCEVAGVDQGLGVARALDESGAVIVLGAVVFLRPDLVAKAIENMIPTASVAPANNPQNKELKEMEKKKAEIDMKAEGQVRRELWCGLGFLVIQTAAFMRLTFWELTWDVMEPICFYVTSLYFMAGYAFFLRTSRDPSFEGFFESRFAAKQKRLMKARNFDIAKFNELRRAGPFPPSQPLKESSSSSCSSYSDCHRRSTLFGPMH